MGSTPIPFALQPNRAAPVVPTLKTRSSSIVTQLRNMVQALSEEENRVLGPIPLDSWLHVPQQAKPKRPRSAGPRRADRSSTTTFELHSVGPPIAPVAVQPTNPFASVVKPPSAPRRVSAANVKTKSTGSPQQIQAVAPPSAAELPVTGRQSKHRGSVGSGKPTPVRPQLSSELTIGLQYLMKRRGSIVDRSQDRTFACLGSLDQASEIKRALESRGWTDIRYNLPDTGVFTVDFPFQCLIVRFQRAQSTVREVHMGPG